MVLQDPLTGQDPDTRPTTAADDPEVARTLRVFTWDYKAQPPLAEILATARDMPGRWFWFCPETGSDEYALILSGRELNADEAERILWERMEG